MLKDAVGQIYDGLGKRFVKLHFNKLAIRKLKPELIALLVFALKALVYFLAIGAELNVAVFANKLKVNYGYPSFSRDPHHRKSYQASFIGGSLCGKNPFFATLNYTINNKINQHLFEFFSRFCPVFYDFSPPPESSSP